MTEWKEYKFSDFVDINPLVRIPKNIPISFVEMKDLDPSMRYCESSQLKLLSGGSRFINGDTLFARITPCLENGKICQVRYLQNNIGFGSTEFHVFRAKNGISDTNFVYYLSRWNEVREHAELNLEGSSGRQRVSKEAFDNLYLLLPPLPEQIRIASILSSLDDKIDLLHRENKTLETMAETLFRQWFIEEAKEDWEEIPFGEVIEIFDNKRKPLSKMERDKMKNGTIFYPYYGAAEIMDYIDSYLFDGEFILMGEDGTVKTDDGYPILQYVSGKFWPNNHAHVLKAKPPYNNCFIWNYLKTTNIEYIVTGAVQPKINQANLLSLPFYKYPYDLLEKYKSVTQNVWEKTMNNNKQIQTLIQQRDSLLPKLMSGEVKI
ncbi:MAG: restriction endonuclease subunit S [Paludibacteraceae bacterium]|nr:restriction endonuclease subunit S [Paludibacteraceae bacterium]